MFFLFRSPRRTLTRWSVWVIYMFCAFRNRFVRTQSMHFAREPCSGQHQHNDAIANVHKYRLCLCGLNYARFNCILHSELCTRSREITQIAIRYAVKIINSVKWLWNFRSSWNRMWFCGHHNPNGFSWTKFEKSNLHESLNGWTGGLMRNQWQDYVKSVSISRTKLFILVGEYFYYRYRWIKAEWHPKLAWNLLCRTFTCVSWTQIILLSGNNGKKRLKLNWCNGRYNLNVIPFR